MWTETEMHPNSAHHSLAREKMCKLGELKLLGFTASSFSLCEAQTGPVVEVP